MKNPFIAKNLAGIILGMMIINAVAFTVAHLLANGHNVPALFTAGLGSSLCFMLSLILPIPLLHRRFIIGIIVSFIGGFLIAIFYANYKNVIQQFDGMPIRKKLSIDEALELEKKAFFQLDSTRTKILFELQGRTGSDHRGDVDEYIVIPIVDNDWDQTDSIKLWAGYSLYYQWMGMQEEDQLNQLRSGNATGFEYTEPYMREGFSSAIKEAANKHNIASAHNAVVVRFNDREYETGFWKRRFWIAIAIVNSLWILGATGAVKKGPQPKRNTNIQ